MGLVEELKDLHPAVLLVGGIVVGGIVLVVVGILLLVLAAVVGTFVLNLGGTATEQVQAGATVETDPGAGTLEVVWTSNQNADYLVVEWEASGGSVGVQALQGAEQTADRRVRLTAIGGSVTLSETDPATDTAVSVTVTAVNDEGNSVVLEKDVTV